jgi:hypothetical protein
MREPQSVYPDKQTGSLVWEDGCVALHRDRPRRRRLLSLLSCLRARMRTLGSKSVRVRHLFPCQALPGGLKSR